MRRMISADVIESNTKFSKFFKFSLWLTFSILGFLVFAIFILNTIHVISLPYPLISKGIDLAILLVTIGVILLIIRGVLTKEWFSGKVRFFLDHAVYVDPITKNTIELGKQNIHKIKISGCEGEFYRFWFLSVYSSRTKDGRDNYIYYYDENGKSQKLHLLLKTERQKKCLEMLKNKC